MKFFKEIVLTSSLLFVAHSVFAASYSVCPTPDEIKQARFIKAVMNHRTHYWFAYSHPFMSHGLEWTARLGFNPTSTNVAEINKEADLILSEMNSFSCGGLVYDEDGNMVCNYITDNYEVYFSTVIFKTPST